MSSEEIKGVPQKEKQVKKEKSTKSSCGKSYPNRGKSKWHIYLKDNWPKAKESGLTYTEFLSQCKGKCPK